MVTTDLSYIFHSKSLSKPLNYFMHVLQVKTRKLGFGKLAGQCLKNTATVMYMVQGA